MLSQPSNLSNLKMIQTKTNSVDHPSSASTAKTVARRRLSFKRYFNHACTVKRFSLDVQQLRAALNRLDEAIFDVESRERTQTVNASAKTAVQQLYKLMEMSQRIDENANESDNAQGDRSDELKRCGAFFTFFSKMSRSNCFCSRSIGCCCQRHDERLSC